MMQRSSETDRRHARSGMVRAAMALAAVLGCASLRAHADCVGDCFGNGVVTVDGLIVMANIALGMEPLASCPAGDQNHDGTITVNELITGGMNLLNGCTTPVADAVARDANGIALSLGQTLTTEGVVTVSAGVFANQKLKIFVQDGGAGIMAYHQSSADVQAFQLGQRLRATGVIRQQDPTSDANPATGTVLIDVTQGTALVLSDGNPLPEPQLLTLATLNAHGIAYAGTLVRVMGVHKISGDWPTITSKSTQVGISDDGGTTQAILRIQRPTITQPLVDELNAIGDGPFTLVGIVIQDDENGGGTLLSGFEIWLRGADDVTAE
jgi:hypothetical protein